jgi:PKHD-type hydroxylase
VNAVDTYIGTPIVLPQWFDAAACDAWLAIASGRASQPADLVVPREGYRQAEVAWIDTASAPPALLARLREAVDFANRWYEFELGSFEAALQYVRYAVGGHSGWHADCGMEQTASRKLSLSVQLTDPAEYDGGVLEFLPGGRPQLGGTRGCVIAFPAFLAHRVTPVVRGSRSALVAWIHGPPFR